MREDLDVDTGWAQRCACVAGLREWGWVDHTQPGGQWATQDPSWDLSCLIPVLMPWRRRWSLLSASCQVMPSWWHQLIESQAELWPGVSDSGDWWADRSLVEPNKHKCPAHRKEEPFAVVEIQGQLWIQGSSGSSKGQLHPGLYEQEQSQQPREGIVPLYSALRSQILCWSIKSTKEWPPNGQGGSPGCSGLGGIAQPSKVAVWRVLRSTSSTHDKVIKKI